MHESSRIVAGCMSGTSCDGVDVVVAAIDGHGIDLQARILGAASQPLGELGERLRAFADGAACTAEAISVMAAELAAVHIASVHAASAVAAATPELIAVHGQTVFHRPPLTWQLVDLAAIAAGTNARVVGDLRASDCARGGQGAPLTPLADWLTLRSASATRLVVNLGGFINGSLLPAAGDLNSISGWDLCPCNQWLNRLARNRLEQAYDRNGDSAASGQISPAHRQRWLGELQHLAKQGRSLGSGDEQVGADDLDLSPADALATAVACIAAMVGERATTAAVDEVILAGGGAYNRALVSAIAAACSAPVHTSDALGLPVDQREALAMAVLAAAAEDGISIGLPQVTGATNGGGDGAWYHPAATQLTTTTVPAGPPSHA